MYAAERGPATAATAGLGRYVTDLINNVDISAN